MTDTITKPRISAAAKIAMVLAAAAVLLAVFAQAVPGSGLFFPLVSLWCNLALFACVLLVLRVAGVKFDLFHKAVILGLWAAALVYFFWALGRRSQRQHALRRRRSAQLGQSIGHGTRVLLAKFHTIQYNNSPGHCPAPRGRKMQNVPPLSKQTGHFYANITFWNLPQRP